MDAIANILKPNPNGVSSSPRPSTDAGSSTTKDETKLAVNRRTQPRVSIADLSLLKRRMSRLRFEWKTRKSPSAVERKPKYENTYKTEPDKDRKFIPEQAERIIYETIENIAKGVKYDPKECALLSRSIVEEVKDKLRIHMNIPRHKVTCYAVVTQRLGQGIQMSSRCVWDEQNDGCASARFENQHLIVLATAFLTYFD
ncbi:dynein light chain Tctex-type protein 2B-like [Tubulanus polymorphus]|uniref:dynein light chain Tctex-type protein 2B-like n=1 Tax=Tubulanus polymorphus TaxID=672921 RepID=UPI003DA4D0B9